MVQGIVNTFNKSRNPHQHMQSDHQNAPLHSAGFINQGSNTNNSLNSQERIGQNLLSSTVVVQDKNPNGDSEEDDSNDPDIDGVFENDKGERDYKAYMIHWRAKYKERAQQKGNS